MLSFFRQGMRVWSLWTLLVTFALFANPVGVFGAAELFACLGPLILTAVPQIRREVAFGLGVPMITLLALLDAGTDSPIRLVTAWLVFSVGVLLIGRLVEGRRELEAIAGRVAFGPESEDERSEQRRNHFTVALEREVGRSRRHEKPFIVLAFAPDAHSLATDQPEALRSGLMISLAERRANLEIADLLAEELHVYADVSQTRDNVLALVPETDPEDVEPLVHRLRESIHERLGIEVQIGRAAFPSDAISAIDLISVAERARKATKLRSIRDEPHHPIEGELPDLVSESQG